jgi:hypothetical protein
VALAAPADLPDELVAHSPAAEDAASQNMEAVKAASTPALASLHCDVRSVQQALGNNQPPSSIIAHKGNQRQMSTTVQNGIIRPGMPLDELRLVPAFSALKDAALRVSRTCLVVTCEGAALCDVPADHLELVRKHAIGSVAGGAPIDVDATFSRSGTQFIHWNKRTGEWSPGIENPPLASDGRKGGWIFVEVKAGSAELARAMAERYVVCKNASFKGGIVALTDTVAIVSLDGKEIAY